MNNNGIKLSFPFPSAQEFGIKSSMNIEFLDSCSMKGFLMEERSQA